LAGRPPPPLPFSTWCFKPDPPLLHLTHHDSFLCYQRLTLRPFSLPSHARLCPRKLHHRHLPLHSPLPWVQTAARTYCWIRSRHHRHCQLHGELHLPRRFCPVSIAAHSPSPALYHRASPPPSSVTVPICVHLGPQGMFR
jgi:hypothetical protein